MAGDKPFGMICPIHKINISGKYYSISYEGIPTECPFSYCPTCKCFYSSKKYEYLKNNVHDKKNRPIVFIDVKKYIELQLVNASAVTTPNKSVRSCEAELLKLQDVYLVENKTKQCPICKSMLVTKLNSALNQNGDIKKIAGKYCSKCNKFFIDEKQWEFITRTRTYQVNIYNNFLNTNVNKTIHKFDITSNAPSETRSDKDFSHSKKSCSGIVITDTVLPDIFVCYEDLETTEPNIPIEYQILYTIMFRRFDKTVELLKDIEQDRIETILNTAYAINGVNIPIAKSIKWNLPYICAFDEKNNTDILKKFNNIVDNEDDEFPVFEYDSKTVFDKNIFDIFFNSQQIMLDVKPFEKQILASKQVKNSSMCLVADEVGTGKTVSAFYAIRDIINAQESKGQIAHILIVCPRNKKLDWQSDVRRQLGRYAHIAEQGDNGLIYNNELKNVFFKKYEHKIFICGPTRGADKDGNRSSLKGSLESWSKDKPWHLVVIDEGHNLFNNYSDIKSERCMIMTATPIVVNSTGTIAFDKYLNLLCRITSKHIQMQIDPIIYNNPSENDIFTNWFREDMGLSSAKRKISFVSCERHELMLFVFYNIAAEKGMLTALQYVQDDEYLFKIAREKYDIVELPQTIVNHKLNKLIEILKANNKSYIIFCEHVEVVENIYEKLRNTFSETVVASKCGAVEKVSLIEPPERGQLINTLTHELRAQKRVFLIATGKTGGTGLNLGEFDGVIHYELPFTSIELEQRYGRVDRMDKTDVGTEKDMIFMLNACTENEDDFEINRMLHYCTRKIDATCKYMPIRNTVLFYPEFIKRNTVKILEALCLLQSNTLLSEDNEIRMDILERRHFSYTSKISQMSAWKSIRVEDDKSSVYQICKELLKCEKRSDITDEQYSMICDFVSFEEANQEDFNCYSKAVKQYREHKKICEQWLGILGAAELKDDSVFVNISVDTNNDDDEYEENVPEFSVNELAEDDLTESDSGSKEQLSMFKIISLLADDVRRVTMDNLQLSNRLSNGVFWYENGRIKRATVAEYRAAGVNK